MVIDREFFFRGWLPAGLVINARLLSASSSRGETVIQPLLNPVPGAHWSVYQPTPVFPVSQATDRTAIFLMDPFPETALVMLPLEKWYGSGTPYILALNTWYEGRIQEVSGADVMAVRITMLGSSREYYSYYSGLSKPDVKLRTLPCTIIPGRNQSQYMMLETGDFMQYEPGFPPVVTLGDSNMYARISEIIDIHDMSIAGLRSAFASLSPGDERHFVQCQITSGASSLTSSPKYVGLATKADAAVRPFYLGGDGMLMSLVEADALDAQGKFYTLSVLRPGEDVVHYN